MPIPAHIENLIREFENRKGEPAFFNIEREKVALELRERIEFPSRINQGNASLCGSAVFVYCLAKKRPKQYAEFVMDLFEKGDARIGRLRVKPREGCRNYKPSAAGAIKGCDWIALAGLRDSQNKVFDYDDHEDRLAGITMPDKVSEWFEFSDFQAIQNNTNWIFDKSMSALLEAHHLYVTGAMVCLFVGSYVLQGVPKGKFPADHWVVLESPIRFDGKFIDYALYRGEKFNRDQELLSKKIYFEMYTWAQEKYPVNFNNPKLTVKEFLDYFYGYVSAR